MEKGMREGKERREKKGGPRENNGEGRRKERFEIRGGEKRIKN